MISHAETNPEPIHPNMQQAIFFDNERHIGFHPVTNEPIFTGSRLAGEFGPKIDKNTGEQVQRKHAMTGEPLVGVRELKRTYQKEFIYTKVSDGRGNISRQDCEHPDVLWARHRAEQERGLAEEKGRDLLAELGRSGLTADQIKAAVATAQQLEPGPSPSPGPGDDEPVREEAPVDTRDFPVAFAPGRFYLTPKHEKAVIAGEAKCFEGSRVDADEAMQTMRAEEKEAEEALDAIPAF